MVIVRSLVYMYTNFRQNRTIFRPYFGCESHIKGRDNPKFWNFSSLTKIWIWPEFEKNPRCQTWGWFYTVSWNIGCGPTPIWAGWDQKYFSHLNNFQKGLMGPSFGKIPEIEVLPVFMTWKMCHLKICLFCTDVEKFMVSDLPQNWFTTSFLSAHHIFEKVW